MSLSQQILNSRKQGLLLIHATILYTFCVISLGCSGAFADNSSIHKPQQKAPAFLNALSGFEFVGSGSCLDHSSIPSHSIEKQQMPIRFEKGKAYVFHHAPIDNQHLLYLLKDKLESKGYKILEFVDRGPGRFIGGLAFRIKFEDEKYTGIIFNTLDNQIVNNPSSSKPLSLDDYVLLIEQGDDPFDQ